MVDGDSDKDDILGFVWEDMNTYKGQREHFTNSIEPRGAAKQSTETVNVWSCFSTEKL
jgi:hypothetical protein